MIACGQHTCLLGIASIDNEPLSITCPVLRGHVLAHTSSHSPRLNITFERSPATRP